MKLEYSPRGAALVHALAERWWAFVVRGVAAILFGILTLVSPRSSLLAIVFLFGGYAIVDGVLALVASMRRAGAGERWGWMFLQGIVGIAAGLVTFFYPALTALVLLIVIACWAVVRGIAEIATAIRLRKHIRGEWLLITGGVLSVAFGVLLFLMPGAGTLALLFMIGGYAIVFGALSVALGLKLRTWHKRGEDRVAPYEGLPVR